MNGRRESNRPRAERQASVNRREGTRSRYQRCPGCKQLRLKRMEANHWRAGRKAWAPITDGGLKVCHLCQTRHSEEQ